MVRDFGDWEFRTWTCWSWSSDKIQVEAVGTSNNLVEIWPFGFGPGIFESADFFFFF